MNSARNTVVQFVVQFWNSVFVVNRSLGKISNSSSLNHVSDSDTLDSLVLGHAFRAVDTSDGLDVSSTLLVSTVGCSLLWHCKVIEFSDSAGGLKVKIKEQGNP